MTMLVYGVKTATEMLILYVMLILFPEHPVDVNNFQIFGSPYFARARLHASFAMPFSPDIANSRHVDGRFL